MMMVAWDTGMRLGELMGLTWQCVDTKRLTLSVERSVKRSRAQGVYLSPDLKSKYAYRVLPITKETALALTEHRKQQKSAQLPKIAPHHCPLILTAHKAHLTTIFADFELL